MNTQYKVRQCSQCRGSTEFYCHTCKHDLCLLCKERHVIDLDTKHHDVVIYREKFNYIPSHFCVRHPDRMYDIFCQSWGLSVCFRCLEHQQHQSLDIREVYHTTRQQHRGIIDNIRSETLFDCHVLLAQIQTDMQTFPSRICHHQSQISTKVQRLKDLIATVVSDVKTRNTGSLIARIQQLKRNLNKQLVLDLHLQTYEDRYEQSANRAVQFLLFIKTTHVPQIKISRDPHKKNSASQSLCAVTSQDFQINNSPSQLLSVIPEIQISTGKRRVGIDECLKLTSTPILHTSFCVRDVSKVYHISGLTSGCVWVTDGYNNLILTDTAGDTVHSVVDIIPLSIGGIHTVSSSGELIYIDSQRNINKLSIATVTTPVKNAVPWTERLILQFTSTGNLQIKMGKIETQKGVSEPKCVYCSQFTGDLLVGMWNTDAKISEISRYDAKGQHLLTIQNDNSGNKLYGHPRYITENKNTDIIVSDRCRVVVTERGGDIDSPIQDLHHDHH